MKWRSDSEVVFGFLQDGKIDPNAVEPQWFFPPYDMGTKLIQQGADSVVLMEKVSTMALHVAELASGKVKGDPYLFVEQLKVSSLRAQVGNAMEPIVRQLKRGEDADIAKASAIWARLDNGQHDFVTGDTVEPEPMIYVPSHYPPLDKFVGGYPQAGLTIIAGVTGTGKTSFAIELLDSAIGKRKKAGVVTLEMTNGQLMYRAYQISDKMPDPKRRKYLYMSEEVYDVDGVYAAISKLASKTKLHCIVIDYADMLVGEREQSEAVMGRIYHRLSVLAKNLMVPVILIAQYRRTDGRIPTIEDIRYSGRAEQASSMILLLQNLDAAWTRSRMTDNKNPIPYVEGVAQIIVGKLRYVMEGKQEYKIGAINVPWDDTRGKWGRRSMGWIDLRGRV
jgi:hypothetical protein